MCRVDSTVPLSLYAAAVEFSKQVTIFVDPYHTYSHVEQRNIHVALHATDTICGAECSVKQQRLRNISLILKLK